MLIIADPRVVLRQVVLQSGGCSSLEAMDEAEQWQLEQSRAEQRQRGLKVQREQQPT